VKFPAFEYAAPASLAEAVALLAASGGTAKPIAGGQSLLPMMAFRVVAPALLVDLRKVPDLDQIHIGGDGVRLGARVRWRDIQTDARLQTAHPLLVAAVAHVAHYQIRNRGTVGGSLAHADPAAELPGIAVVCDAELTLAGPAGRRVVAAKDFFLGPLSTALAADELIVELYLPSWPAARRWGFQEFALRRGDFALAGVAAWYDEDRAGHAADAHVAVIGACSRPHRITQAEVALNGRPISEETLRAAAAAVAQAVTPPSDLHAGAAYRRSLTGTLLERALRREPAGDRQ
jgi:carbon-monoxide dehydrogenase medium subunit